MATSNCGTDPIPCIENVLVTGLVRGFGLLVVVVVVVVEVLPIKIVLNPLSAVTFNLFSRTDRQTDSPDNHLGKHLSQMLGGGVVAALLQVGLHLVLHLGLVQVPGVLLLGVLAGRGVRGSGDLVDGAGLLQYLVRQLLGRGQHLGVMGRDQILDELLQLLPVHLEQSLTDGDPDGDLVRVPDPVDGESHNMLAPEDISAVTAAGHAGYLASANKLKISAGSKFTNIQMRFCLRAFSPELFVLTFYFCAQNLTSHHTS